MRIIKTGSLPANELLIGTCSHCKAEVEFSKGEAKEYCGRNESSWSIACPTDKCLHTIVVSE